MDEVVKMQGLSIVIPSYWKHADYTEELVTSLAIVARSVDFDIEVIVTDDEIVASDRLRHLCERTGARYQKGERRIAARMNRAVESARYSDVLIIPGDCLLSLETIQAHRRHLAASADDVAGVVGPVPYSGPMNLAWRIADFYGYNIAFKYANRYHRVPWAPTNVCFKRSLFLEVGGYPENGWTVTGGEDVALGVRLLEANLTLESAPDAILMNRRDDLSALGLYRTLIRYGIADAYLSERHPQLAKVHLNLSLVLILLGLGVGKFDHPIGKLAASASLIMAAPRIRHQFLKLKGHPSWRTDGALLVVGSVLMDAAFDFGVLVAAVRHRKPALVLRQFDYLLGRSWN